MADPGIFEIYGCAHPPGYVSCQFLRKYLERFLFLICLQAECFGTEKWHHLIICTFPKKKQSWQYWHLIQMHRTKFKECKSLMYIFIRIFGGKNEIFFILWILSDAFELDANYCQLCIYIYYGKTREEDARNSLDQTFFNFSCSFREKWPNSSTTGPRQGK